MDIMKPIASSDTPTGNEWLYEVKYDGFRCVMVWEKNNIRLISRNNKELTANFPEIVDFCKTKQASIESLLPLKLDGELVILNTAYQANFSWLQKRGRLKNKESIRKAANTRPASFLAFDLLEQKGTSTMKAGYQERKNKLLDFFHILNLEPRLFNGIGLVEVFDDPDALWKIIFDYRAEGMIAKRKKSIYHGGKNHNDWFKIKNWRIFHGLLTQFDSNNGYFTASVYENETILEVGKCKHGLDSETFQTLKSLFLTNGEKLNHVYRLPPAICAAINTLDLHRNELREPEFKRIGVDIPATDCTIEKMRIDMAMLPDKIDYTNTEKVFWPAFDLTKGDLLVYIREIAPYMLPFLHDRVLTLIRCPDGVEEESFFQKHLPGYAPSFIDGIKAGNEKLILCNQLESLVWFANHGAIEYHVPFQTIHSKHPMEIVFDLDPPDRDRFELAIQAATIIKQLLDDLELISFIKTSGNKGLQIHIPIAEGSMSYDETALFTQAIAWTVENAYPDTFTTERLKKNRNERLYIDYVQHGKDKTLIAPYSPRKTDEATVATPLMWEEVKEGLRPEQFTIENVLERVETIGCPFRDFFLVGKAQKLDKVLQLVKG